ncbi:hypothetical protein FEF65_10730 [Mariprofundus erugo]|uniref:Uncharacterized protein n=1 Tax=Mariprofundus erugo TaxID=2528639 RepID=A0A5R9GHN0_9PROT|nr:plasmid partition protein ParG [Mariprofundus erugo]TLS66281.1 hypothetical protein FEF65_10730 [Mariprofundus erugo]
MSGEKLKLTSFMIEPSLLARFKIACVKEGVSVGAKIRQLIENSLREIES